MKQETREYISQVLNNELYLLEERSSLDWESDPNKNELKLCQEAIKQINILD
tara:strand:- start:333 stop:488 length:156 start_codon:yes stop_codon:yes gene_type:complete